MWNPFKPKYALTVTFIMKSGKEVKVLCTSVKIQKNGNELVGYQISGAQEGDTFYMCLSEIAAIQYKDN